MGRPFLVGDEIRMAPAQVREGWCAVDLDPRTDHLDVVTRMLLAGYWTDLGRAKHASVGAFAKVALQLLGLGAPPEILARAHAAMGDELRHARFAFALASAFRAAPLAPGALPVGGAVGEIDPAEVTAELVRAGCTAATVASMEARELLERVTDPAVRFVVGEIARDTSDHVVLSWRTLQWMCDEHADHAVAAIRGEVDHVEAELERRRSEPPSFPQRDEGLLRAGYVSARVRADLSRAALERVLFGLRALVDKALPTADEAERATLV